MIVNPSISRNGDPVGGVVGSLRSLQKLCNLIDPDSIIIVWDGPGGSKKRKSIFKEYKEGRKPIRFNRFVDNLTPEQHEENRKWQMKKLYKYFSLMPVKQFVISGVEADDVISHICQKLPDQKVIVSSDKDFIQIISENIILYRPIQNEILTVNKILENYKIHPNNFALARAISGDDRSDNIKGLKGVGLKSIAKRFPEFLKENRVTIDSVIKESKKQLDLGAKQKIYSLIAENKPLIENNYKIGQLYVPLLSAQSRQKIDEILVQQNPQLDKLTIYKLMSEDGINDWNSDALFNTFKKISHSY